MKPDKKRSSNRRVDEEGNGVEEYRRFTKSNRKLAIETSRVKMNLRARP